jgi:uncharacterized protein (DUF2147 family)
MKRFFMCLPAFAMAVTPALADAKMPLEGRWKNGHMEIIIAPCGPALCGTVVKASAQQQEKAERGSGTELIGARLITDIRPAGTNSYRANVYVASRDMNTSGTIRQTAPNRLNVRGCVLGFICKSSNWDRISR